MDSLSDQASPPLSRAAGTEKLGQAMGRLARALQSEHSNLELTLEAITDAATGNIPGADHAGITLVVGRQKVETRAATDELPREIDRLQERLREGPCLQSVWEHETVRIDDMASETRWPRLAAGARDLGVGSALTFQLFVDGDNLGALNLYAVEPDRFGPESEDVGYLFATHAAIALASAQHESQLTFALTTRDIIGQAKGILMERHKIDADQAFALLTKISRDHNIKLRDLADTLAHSGSPHRQPVTDGRTWSPAVERTVRRSSADVPAVRRTPWSVANLLGAAISGGASRDGMVVCRTYEVGVSTHNGR